MQRREEGVKEAEVSVKEWIGSGWSLEAAQKGCGEARALLAGVHARSNFDFQEGGAGRGGCSCYDDDNG
eukprot:2819558-Rhodomonas_salina.1